MTTTRNMRPVCKRLIWPALILSATNAFAQLNCEPLRPTPPQDINVEASGKIDASLRRFISIQGNIEGAYKEAARDVLKEYPNAGRLFLWSRMLYLYCETIRTSKLTDQEKLNKLDDILKRLDSPPPTSSGENLLDPPVLQFGMTASQARAFLRARRPASFQDNDIIGALQAVSIGKAPAATPRGNKNVLRANATLFGLHGETSYGFDEKGLLSWTSVWNVCARDIHEFSDMRNVHPSWLKWSRHKDMGADDSVACDVITGVKDVLRARFGEPIESESDRPLGRDMPDDAEICQDLFHHGLVRCGDYTRAFFTERSRFLAQDRLTPIDLQVRTLRYSAKELKEQSIWMKKTRERKVAIITISSATGADVVDPVVTGKIYFRYLN